MDLGETAEKGMIPLVFSGMHFNGSWEYRREDTGEVVGGEYVEILEPHVTVLVPYEKNLIQMSPGIARANGLLCDTSDILKDEKGKMCIANYAVVDEESSRDAERSSKVWGTFSVS